MSDFKIIIRFAVSLKKTLFWQEVSKVFQDHQNVPLKRHLVEPKKDKRCEIFTFEVLVLIFDVLEKCKTRSDTTAKNNDVKIKKIIFLQVH